MAKVDNLGNLTANTLTSTVAQGTAPLTVTSTTMVTNLNANYVGGLTSSQLGATVMPNLIPNSDFGRRNKWMTFMPETFADTSGWTLAEGTTLGTVATNILTAGNTGTWAARAGLSTWRDVRFSCQFKETESVVNGNTLDCLKYASVSSWVGARIITNGTFAITKNTVAGGITNVTTVAQTFTQNNWYWLEVEFQGTTVIAKLYSSGVNPVAKSSATLCATCTLTATVSDAELVSGYIGLRDTLATAPLWGGLSTGDGGVYVEGWGPESNDVGAANGGGVSWGFDETADAGTLASLNIGKQWALRGYVPATSRNGYLKITLPDGSVAPSTQYTASFYIKTVSKGGSGALGTVNFQETDSALGTAVNNLVNDAGETAWTRKTVTFTTASTTRRMIVQIKLNEGNAATGSVLFNLIQLEQGSVATPWRNAPSDLAGWQMAVGPKGTSKYTISAGPSEVDSRDLAINLFLPYDATVLVHFMSAYTGSANGNGFKLDIQADGTASPSVISWFQQESVAGEETAFVENDLQLSAGHHRIVLVATNVGGGTPYIGNESRPRMFISVTPGKMTSNSAANDLAEEYSVADPTIEAGDVVRTSSLQGSLGSASVEKVDKAYDPSIFGIISTKPAITFGNYDSTTGQIIDTSQNRWTTGTDHRPVALSGRVPVKVTNENGPIHRGDTLTSSEKFPGFAMRATKAGRSIGIAMEDFTPINNSQLPTSNELPNNSNIQTGKIMTFVNLSWYDPDVYLTDQGQFVVSRTEQPSSTVTLASNGLIATGSAVPLQSQNMNTYAITNTQTKETIERTGAFNNLFVANLKVGSLDVSTITNDQLKNLELRLKNLELATGSAVLSASISGLLNEPISSNSGVLSQLTVSGRTILNDLGVTGGISSGLLSIDGLNSSITSLSDIKFNLPGGQVTIDKNGNMTVQKLNVSSNSAGSVVIPAGTTSVTISTNSLTPKSLIFVTPEIPVAVGASESATTTISVTLKDPLTQDLKVNWWVVN